MQRRETEARREHIWDERQIWTPVNGLRDIGTQFGINPAGEPFILDETNSRVVWDVSAFGDRGESFANYFNKSDDSTMSSRSSSPVHMTLDELRRSFTKECKLNFQASKRISVRDLIPCTDPVPRYSISKAKQVSPTEELDISVIDQPECLKLMHQDLLDYILLSSQQLKPDSYPSIKDDYLPMSEPSVVQNFAILARDGLSSSIVLKQTDALNKDYKRILISPIGSKERPNIDRIKAELELEYPSIKGVRQFSAAELDLVPKGSFELNFRKGEQGKKLCEKNAWAKPLPDTLDTAGRQAKKLAIFFHWAPYPLESEHTVYVKQKDYDKAFKILAHNNDLIRRVWSSRPLEETFNLNGESHQPIQVEYSSKLSAQKPSEVFRTEEDYIHATRFLLEMNGVDLVKIEFNHTILPHISNKEIIFKINHRMGRCAVNGAFWEGKTTPYVEEEWRDYIDNNEVPWRVVLHPYDPNNMSKQRSGCIEFKDFEFGMHITRYMEINMDHDFCRLHKRQKEGLLFTIRISWKIFVPPEIRKIYDAKIKELDVRVRLETNFDKKWARFRDLPGNFISVEGFDAAYVELQGRKLIDLLKGEKFDCSSPERSQLLYGCGISYLNHQYKLVANSIFLSINRLNQEVIIHGEQDSIDIFKQALDDYGKNTHNYAVDSVILIDAPRFLPKTMQIVLDHNNEKRLRKLLGGGCTIEFRLPNRLCFKGSVHQYNKLNILLDNTQHNIFEKYSKKVMGLDRARERFVAMSCCPVCLTAYVDKFRVNCGHAYCFDCLLFLINSGIQSNSLPLICHKARCGKSIGIKDILSLLFDERTIRYKEFYPDRLEPLFRSAVRAAAKNEKLLHCIKPGCEGLIEPRIMVPDMPRPLEGIKCKICNTVRCPKCANPPHENVSCEREAELRQNDELSLESYLKSNNKVKKCPTKGCEALITKEDGCNHMQCSNCNIHFCWLCLVKNENQGAIYKHLQEVHGGSGGGFEFLDQLDRDERFNAPQMFAQLRQRMEEFGIPELGARQAARPPDRPMLHRITPPPGLVVRRRTDLSPPPGFEHLNNRRNNMQCLPPALTAYVLPVTTQQKKMADVFECGSEEGGTVSDQDSPMRLNGTSPSSAAVASRLYGTRSRRDSMGSEDMISFSDQDDAYNQPSIMSSIQKQMQEMAEKAQSGDEERTRLKTENAILSERFHIFEEQSLQTEKRLEEQLEYEKTRNKDVLLRAERERQLEADRYSLKLQIMEKDLDQAKRESDKAKQETNKLKEELEKTQNELEESKLLTEAIEEERIRIEKQFKQYKKEAQEEIDSSSEMVEAFKEQTEELRKRTVPRQGSLADQMVGLEEQLERSRSQIRNLQLEKDDLQAQLLAASVERGTSLLADTPSLADELAGGDSSQLLEALREQEVCNQKLRVYINGILMRVIERHPEILEVGPSSSENTS